MPYSIVFKPFGNISNGDYYPRNICLPFRLSVRVEQLDSLWTDRVKT